MSDLYREQKRMAKKDHRCVECARVIPKGTVYQYASGVWEGAGWSEKFCLRCHSVRGMACEYARYDPDDCPPIGSLAAWLVETLMEGVIVWPLPWCAVISAAQAVLPCVLRRGDRLRF